MSFGWILNIIVIVAAVTIYRNIDKTKMYDAINRIPVVGKFVIVIFGCLKKVVKMMWGTVQWLFGWVCGLPVFRVIAKIVRKIWVRMCKWAEEEVPAK